VSHQAETCGTCHEQEAKDLAQSVHGKAAAAGVRDAPTCTDCHSEHKIEALSMHSSRRISEDVCSRCHASERLNTKYNLPADRVKTFFDSYHGLASSYGSTLAANCASCHGYHKVLASSNPDSTINAAHLVETCGKCHPGANEKFSLSKIHMDLTTKKSAPDLGTQINWWVRKIYLLLIFGVVGAMFVHNGLLFLKKVSAHLRSSGRPVLRMSLAQRWQHAVLATSFIALAVTGFALKFPDSWVAKLLGASEPFRRWSHRIAGIVLLVVGLYHLLYLLASPDGRRLVRDLFPVKKDLTDVLDAVRYLTGMSSEKPKISRFGYAEKMEYWAVVWGTIIMGVTGLMIWFKMDVTHWLPRWMVDVALTIHYYEAILACLAIVVWHFYHVIFDPDVYPLNMACWDGKVSEHWQAEEHPLETPPAPPKPPASSSSSASPSPPGKG
jgi:formate dehydrogenase gamma subunit